MANASPGGLRVAADLPQPVRGVSVRCSRRAVAWDTEVRLLFALFDLRNDGAIQADEFCRAQLFVAEALGETINEDVVLPDTDTSTISTGEMQTPDDRVPLQPPLSRSRTVQTLRQAGFQDVDLDGDGRINFQEFRRWVLMLIESSPSSSATKRRHLKLLIRHLEELKGSWAAIEAEAAAAESLEELKVVMAKAQALGLQLPETEQGRLEQLQAAREDARAAWSASLASMTTVAALAAALEAAAPLFEEGELDIYVERLEGLRQPFEASVTTLSGTTCTVLTSREQSVAALCTEVGRQLGKKAYRIELAHEGGPLSPRTATLEACGVTGPQTQLAAVFGELDPPSELSLEEFLDAVVEHQVVSRWEINNQERLYQEGKQSEEQLRGRYLTQLRQRMQAAERVKQEAEAAARRERERRAELRAEWLAAARRPLELLEPQELHARLRLRLGPKEQASLPSPSPSPDLHLDREGLLRRLALFGAGDAVEQELGDLRATQTELGQQLQEMQEALMSLREEGDRILTQILPVVQGTWERFDSLDMSAVSELKRIAKSSALAIRVLKAVCLLLGERSDMAPKILYDCCFVDRMKYLDKDSITEEIILQLQPFVLDEACQPEVVRTKCGQLCEACAYWVHAMYKYHPVAEEVRPIKIRLTELEGRMLPIQERLQSLGPQVQEREEDLEVFRVSLRNSP